VRQPLYICLAYVHGYRQLYKLQWYRPVYSYAHIQTADWPASADRCHLYVPREKSCPVRMNHDKFDKNDDDCGGDD